MYVSEKAMTTEQIDQVLADKMIENGLELCAETFFTGNTDWALQALRQGRDDVCTALSDSLGIQISEYLGGMDKTVKVIFRYEADDEYSHDETLNDTTQGWRGSINLVAWVDRKSAALSALVATLKSSLDESQKRRIWRSPESTSGISLDVAMVDDEDVRDQRGVGVIAKGQRIYSTQVWPVAVRSDQLPESSVSYAGGLSNQIPLLELLSSFDPALAPERRIIDHAYAIEKVEPDQRGPLEYHLTELKVALIRRLISDQLSYINIARKWFTVGDLEDIYKRRIGIGCIGGKAAGMMLAARILHETADEDLRACLHIPESYFIGSNVLYLFLAMNGLLHWNDEKYKPEDEIRVDYAQVQEQFAKGDFPPEILEELRTILAKIGNQPLIVRSSSQLEDNFGTSFAGKYESFFCPNQGTLRENLENLMQAIKCTYASTLKPDALLYRRQKGLQDYDERMAVLIQIVQGEKFGRYFLPHAAGVAFSHNSFRWSPQIRRKDGIVRLVWGLGTRAVGRVGDDYPRLVALSHPHLQPDDSAQAIRHYSQHYVDVLDLADNELKTLPVEDVLSPRYPPLRYIAQLEQDGYFSTPRMRVSQEDIPRMAVTFNEFLRRTPFADRISKMLRTVEQHYHAAVDMEFTVHIPEPRAPQPDVVISLLQCRPQSQMQDISPVDIPDDLSEEQIIFRTRYMVPRGYLGGIRYVLYVRHEAYYALPSTAERNKLSTAISRLNAALAEKSFICVGPGRWGSTNTDLGVYVSYADIYNVGALVELSGEGIGPDPEPSLGTHFFQDLMEANIYPLVVRVDDDSTRFNQDFFYKTPNSVLDWIELDDSLQECLHLVDVAAFCPGHYLELVMDDDAGQAIAFLVPDDA
jgi:hypothetical protein